MNQDNSGAEGEKKKRTPEEKQARIEKKRLLAEMSPAEREAKEAKRAARKEAKKDETAPD